MPRLARSPGRDPPGRGALRSHSFDGLCAGALEALTPRCAVQEHWCAHECWHSPSALKRVCRRPAPERRVKPSVCAHLRALELCARDEPGLLAGSSPTPAVASVQESCRLRSVLREMLLP
eukprot:12263871-Alexandrium_andersonii.AAC.1